MLKQAEIRFVDSERMGRGRHGWLDSHFHFSFADYYNPDNIRFGILRVVNDDIVLPGTGFDTHPHQDMEIVSYVVEGELTHADSMNNLQTLGRGQVQYMSAGTGVLHSEYNLGEVPLRFLQIWILPDANGYQPNYGGHEFAWEDRVDKWLPLVSGGENAKSKAPIRIHADMNIYVTCVTKGNSLDFEVADDRQAYLILIEGEADINDLRLLDRDALEIIETDFTVKAVETSHVIVFEMAKS